MEKHVTLRDIAKATGVHFTTVGLALRNDPHVNVETAARIREVAAELGYTHNAMLSALSAYRRGGKRFAGVLAYVLGYDPRAYGDNLAEASLRQALTQYAHSQGFRIEVFQVDTGEVSGPQLSRILQVRGIQGVVLAPRLPNPGPISELEWSRFSTVAVGYSVTNVAAHRVAIHHAYNMRLCVRTLRERGYRRIGLILQQDFSKRSLGVMLGSYLAENYAQPEIYPVPPHYVPEVTRESLAGWLKEHRVDAVVLPGYALEIVDWIRELGYRVPEAIGIALISRFGKSDDYAGIDEQNDLLGVAAGKAVFSLLQHNERGLPAHPLYTLVEGRWVDRRTVRSTMTLAAN